MFLNYRGNDSGNTAAWLHSDLARRFGAERVFLDAQSIPPGADYVTDLLTKVRAAYVVLAVIGPSRLATTDPTDPSARRRIDDPRDWIRRELAEAFAADVRVVPILIEHHDGDLTRVATAILEYDWSFIAADEATNEIQNPFTREPWRSNAVQPVAGVGYRDISGSRTAPGTGAVDDEVDGMIRWLYLVVDVHVRVYHARDGRWRLFGEFSVVDLTCLDRADLAAREAAAYA